MINAIGVSKRFNTQEVIKDFSYNFEKGKFYTIIGPSGVGKTTLLNLLAKLELPTEGSVSYEPGVTFGYVFQNHNLLPWRTVRENINLSLEVSRRRPIKNITINGLLDEFGILDAANKYPSEVSGGMAQRAAIIQAVISNPTVLLMDEPFSNIDFYIKTRIQRLLFDLLKETATTTVLVTHDIEDAIILSDVIMILGGAPAENSKTITIAWNDKQRNPITLRQDPRFGTYFAQIDEALEW
jgi:NitT/TauT family transport system ATP-binding protein